MIATTRSASRTPDSIRSTRPDASLTCLRAILRTSMGSGTLSSPLLLCGHHGTGPAGHGIGDPVECGDRGQLATGLDEPAGGLGLRSPGAAPQLPRPRGAAQ